MRVLAISRAPWRNDNSIGNTFTDLFGDLPDVEVYSLCMREQPPPFTTFERWCIAAIYGGGLGNMIDRLRLGYVVDMIETQFIKFPIFNVADCFITCGCFALMVSLFLFNKQFWKEEKK